ncbi:amino acid dehydrogenase [Sulfitobacter sp. SK012]|uniref:NAD(P)/FAD-dependent oxidoreductase n=1 Tax=Sulfitobacter sp. SK012 TaxID=1389005 RepID=UPI000E0BFD36|nr:FAD-binding oxidoreductase [Sulfitobacter sp. SK012]AXI46865.1 amino acid dehydrogenase [Sulfitobacter sp. SK012]
MTKTAVVGAGIVGICTAIALADRGHQVSLIDRKAPGSETSRWNAGVLATSSIIPINNPSLFPKLPGMLLGRYPGFRLNPKAAVTTIPWAARFLRNALPAVSDRVSAALCDLIEHSRKCHAELSERAGGELWKSEGWLISYRGPDGFERAKAHADLLERRGVRTRPLQTEEIAKVEPALLGVFTGAVHVCDSMHTDPKTLLAAYLRLAKNLGVTVIKDTVLDVTPNSAGVSLRLQMDGVAEFNNVVLTAGPWTNSLLAKLGMKIPLAIERGYLQKFPTKSALTRPFFDADGGYVASPRSGGVQISSGTELTTLATPPDLNQFTKAVAFARDAIDLGTAVQPKVAVGNRPTLPDSLPVIGPIGRVPGLWIAAGHQHVGLSTSAGTADLLACLMCNSLPRIDESPFNPKRFGL